MRPAQPARHARGLSAAVTLTTVLVALAGCGEDDPSGVLRVGGKLEGIYEVTAYHENDMGCGDLGEDALDTVGARFLSLRVGTEEIFGFETAVARLYECETEAECRAEPSSNTTGLGRSFFDARGDALEFVVSSSGSPQGSDTCDATRTVFRLYGVDEPRGLALETTTQEATVGRDGDDFCDFESKALVNAPCATRDLLEAEFVGELE